MTDTVIKGSGNSRTLVTVPNALALYPTHEELMTKWATEGIPVDIGQLEAIGCDVIGTLLNKANLLSDSVASNLGLSEPNRTPNQAFNTLRSLASSAQSTANGRLRAQTGTYTGVTSAGGTGLTKTLSFSFTPNLVIVTMSAKSTNSGYYQNLTASPLIMLRNSSNATVFGSGGTGTISRLLNLTWGYSSVVWSYDAVGSNDYISVGHDVVNANYAWIAIG